ncbi:pyrimidine dimer DNA glycosylase/endonuclease V [Oceanobacillus kimchii]|uniref:pyrimidine dimer DNA glycosylase/endonuclease V n=1 Tax=Oceanobacillus kimchii TaxID=746691 RepID=UPI00232EE5F8|nr:pyrimidine dimer DNA glycosylase/endonuclease V [Oceanobacillus kimchii]
MQLFRVSANHQISAQFLDNRRLSKQVLETYQIIRVCLAELQIIEGNTKYLQHPIVKHVFNNGSPYLSDTWRYLQACNDEHILRGGIRNIEFRSQLFKLGQTIEEYKNLYSVEPLPPYFVYGDRKVYGQRAYELYQTLLYVKWSNDKIAPRCGIHR